VNICKGIRLLVKPEEIKCECQHIQNYTFIGDVTEFKEFDELPFNSFDHVYKKYKVNKYVIIGIDGHTRRFIGYHDGNLTLK